MTFRFIYVYIIDDNRFYNIYIYIASAIIIKGTIHLKESEKWLWGAGLEGRRVRGRELKYNIKKYNNNFKNYTSCGQRITSYISTNMNDSLIQYGL